MTIEPRVAALEESTKGIASNVAKIESDLRALLGGLIGACILGLGGFSGVYFALDSSISSAKVDAIKASEAIETRQISATDNLEKSVNNIDTKLNARIDKLESKIDTVDDKLNQILLNLTKQQAAKGK